MRRSLRKLHTFGPEFDREIVRVDDPKARAPVFYPPPAPPASQAERPRAFVDGSELSNVQSRLGEDPRLTTATAAGLRYTASQM